MTEQQTAERKRQADSIVSALRDVPMEANELPQFLMMWIEDPSFSRAAICEAEKKIKAERGWNIEAAP